MLFEKFDIEPEILFCELEKRNNSIRVLYVICKIV